jgi:molybdopterin converting factor small subunit
MATGLIRYWAAAREAAGTAEEPFEATTLAEALGHARRKHGDTLARILIRCSFVIDDAPVGRRDHGAVELSDGCTVEVLPPFAGG